VRERRSRTSRWIGEGLALAEGKKETLKCSLTGRWKNRARAFAPHARYRDRLRPCKDAPLVSWVWRSGIAPYAMLMPLLLGLNTSRNPEYVGRVLRKLSAWRSRVWRGDPTWQLRETAAVAIGTRQRSDLEGFRRVNYRVVPRERGEIPRPRLLVGPWRGSRACARRKPESIPRRGEAGNGPRRHRALGGVVRTCPSRKANPERLRPTRVVPGRGPRISHAWAPRHAPPRDSSPPFNAELRANSPWYRKKCARCRRAPSAESPGNEQANSMLNPTKPRFARLRGLTFVRWADER
jgi:hypothetical protein